jgi:hypothetical protein
MLIDLWYTILAYAVSELGSIVTSSCDDAKTGDIPPTAMKKDKNAITIIVFLSTKSHLLYHYLILPKKLP